MAARIKQIRILQLFLVIELLLTGCSKDSCFPTYDDGPLKADPDFCEDSMMIIEIPDTYGWQIKYKGQFMNEDCAEWLVDTYGLPYKPYSDDGFWEKTLIVAAKSDPRFPMTAGYKLDKFLSQDHAKECFGKTFFSYNTTDTVPDSIDIRKLFGVCSVSSMDDFLPEAKKYGASYDIFYSWELYSVTYIGSPYDSGRVSWLSTYCEAHPDIKGINGYYRRNYWAQKFYFMRKIDVYNDKLTNIGIDEGEYPVRTESYTGGVAYYPYAYKGNRFRYYSSINSFYKYVREISVENIVPEQIALPAIKGLKFIESFTDADPGYPYVSMTVWQDSSKADDPAAPHSETYTEIEMDKTWFIPALDVFCYIEDDGTVSRIVNNPLKITDYYNDLVFSNRITWNAMGDEGEDREWFSEDPDGPEEDKVSGKKYSLDPAGEYYRKLDPAGNPTGQFLRSYNNVKRWRLYNSSVKNMKSLAVKAAPGTNFISNFVVSPSDDGISITVTGLTGDVETFTKSEMANAYFIHCKDVFSAYDPSTGKLSKIVNYPVKMTINGASDYTNNVFTYPPALPACPGFRAPEN